MHFEEPTMFRLTCIVSFLAISMVMPLAFGADDSSNVASEITGWNGMSYTQRYLALRKMDELKTLTQPMADALVASVTTHFGDGNWDETGLEAIGGFSNNSTNVIEVATRNALTSARAGHDKSLEWRAVSARNAFLQNVPVYGIDLNLASDRLAFAKLVLERGGGLQTRDFSFGRIELQAHPELKTIVSSKPGLESVIYEIKIRDSIFYGVHDRDTSFGAEKQIRDSRLYNKNLKMVDDGKSYYNNGSLYIDWKKGRPSLPGLKVSVAGWESGAPVTCGEIFGQALSD
jgi:hypothetical protein